ncbi:MAG: ABC transporter, partial [Pirellulales bacterium]
MIVFLIRRLMWLLLTLWIVFTLSFALMRLVPGGPFSQERQLPAAVIEKWNERYNLNDPPLQQYWDRLREAAVGDLGFSMKLQDYTVNEV